MMFLLAKVLLSFLNKQNKKEIISLVNLLCLEAKS